MPGLVCAHALAGREDRVAVFTRTRGAVLVVADGAGGTGSGAEAAQAVVDAVAAGLDARDCEALAALLARVDATLRRGETTAVIAAIDGNEIHGASVGDSGAWLIPPPFSAREVDDLGHAQRRKPLIGSGRAVPVPFRAALAGGTLLLASDGLFNYTTAERIVACARIDDLDLAARRMIDLVRLRSGALPDDVAVALARRTE